MTHTQLKMARHMLGLPNKGRRSFRNRYFAPHGGPAATDLAALVKAGLACSSVEADYIRGWLTRAGAESVLEKGESLCGEDFPVVVE